MPSNPTVLGLCEMVSVPMNNLSESQMLFSFTEEMTKLMQGEVEHLKLCSKKMFKSLKVEKSLDNLLT